MRYSERVLQIFITLFTSNCLHGYSTNKLSIFSDLFGRHSKKPLIVVVSPGSNVNTNNYDNNVNDDRDDYYAEEDQDIVQIRQADRDSSNEHSINALYNALIPDVPKTKSLRTKQETEEERKAREFSIENALRTRCQARIECLEMCTESEEDRPPPRPKRKPKPKKFCQKSCKAVFDYLIKCPPPGNRKKDKEKKKPKKTTTKKVYDSCEPDSCKSDSCQPDSCKSDSCEPSNKKRGKTCPPAWM